MEDLKRIVLKKLFSRRAINTSHLRLDTLMKCGWKPHEKGLVKKAIKELVNEGLIEWKKKSKKALTLNVKRIAEIKTIIEDDGG